MIAIRPWRWSIASSRSSTPSRAAIGASPVRSARSASAAARCAARTTTARRRRRWPASPTLPDLVVLDLHFALPGGEAAARRQVVLARGPEGAKDGGRRSAPQAGSADSGEAARQLSDASGRHADDHRVGPGCGAARRSAGLSVRERGGRQPQPGRRDLARARRSPHRTGRGHLLGTRPRDGRAAPPARRAGPLAAASADRRRDRDRARASSPSRSSIRARGPRVRWS